MHLAFWPQTFPSWHSSTSTWAGRRHVRIADKGNYRSINVFSPKHKHITPTSRHCSTWKQNPSAYPIYYLPTVFSDSEGTDKHLTFTFDVVTEAKTFHSSRGNESIITNAGIIGTCVKTCGIGATDAFVLQTLIDILKQNNKDKTFIFWMTTAKVKLESVSIQDNLPRHVVGVSAEKFTAFVDDTKPSRHWQ